MNKIFAIIFSLQLMLAPMPAKADAGAAAYVKALSSLALGATGSGAVTSCNFAWSTTMFTFASIAMIAGDIALANSYTDYQKKKKEELKFKLDEFKTQNGDIQKEIIDQRLEMEYEELKNIKRREILHYAIGTVLTGAAFMAYLEIPPTIGGVSPIANPFFIPAGTCDFIKSEVWGISVGQLITIAWGMAASAGGGTSGAGELFTYLQMGLSLAATVVSKAMAKLFSPGAGRAWFFGANAALVYYVAGDLSSRRGIVEDNIEQLKKVVADVKKTETVDGIKAGTGKDISPENIPTQGNIKALAKGVVPKSCLSLQPISHGEGSCATAVKLTVPKFPAGINPLIASVTSNMVSATNDLTSGNFESADVKLAGVAAQAKRMKELLATVQKEHNERMKAENKPTIDFDAGVNKQLASLQNDIGATIGATPGSASMPSPTNSYPSESPAKQAVSPVVTSPDTIAMPDSMSNFFATEELPSETSAQTASLDQSLEQYESSAEDISKKSDVSIFKQVSNRYLLNYTKIFKEKKRIEDSSP